MKKERYTELLKLIESGSLKEAIKFTLNNLEAEGDFSKPGEIESFDELIKRASEIFKKLNLSLEDSVALRVSTDYDGVNLLEVDCDENNGEVEEFETYGDLLGLGLIVDSYEYDNDYYNDGLNPQDGGILKGVLDITVKGSVSEILSKLDK